MDTAPALAEIVQRHKSPNGPMIPRDDGAAIRGRKVGQICANGICTPHEVLIFQDGDPDEWLETPTCPDCGKVMKETVFLRDAGQFHSWYCGAEECRKRHAVGFAQHNGKARAAEIDSRPETVLPAYGVPRKYFHASLDSFDGKESIKNQARVYAANPTGNLYLWGPTGTGKTYLAAAIVREVIRAGGRLAYFRPVSELLLDIRATFHRSEDAGAETEADVLNRYAAYGFLVLDDLGAGTTTEFSAERILTLLNRRMNDLRPTVITGNFALPEVGELLDARLASRLTEGAVWKLDGPDRRARR